MGDIGILLADDHKLMREGLRMLISEQENMTVVSEAEDGETAIGLSQELHPDIIIMDISMPGVNGIEATRRIKAAYPDIRIITLSMHLDYRMILEMFAAGASAYLLKECAFQEVISAINSVSAGSGYVSSRVAAVLAKEFLDRFPQYTSAYFGETAATEQSVLGFLAAGRDIRSIAAELHMKAKTAEIQFQQLIFDLVVPRLKRGSNDRDEQYKTALTGREKEILKWVKEGKNNWEIASILDITQDTVKFHLKNIFHKLNVTNRSQAISVALEQNVI